jgi:hypothetical protein
MAGATSVARRSSQRRRISPETEVERAFEFSTDRLRGNCAIPGGTRV